MAGKYHQSNLNVFHVLTVMQSVIIRDGNKFLLSGTIENIEKNFCKKIEKM